MKRLVVFLLCLLSAWQVNAQYQFNKVCRTDVTPVKNQAISGTCWCFATTSFMEAELLRMGKGTYDLSEMYIVRQKYMNQLADNFLRRGKGNIGQGSLSHTFINAYKQVGIVPEEAFTGIRYDSKVHNHIELEKYLHSIANAAISLGKQSPEYKKLINSVFDIYLGTIPTEFTYNGKEYTPESFTQSLGLNMDDYIELTSFTHHPYYQRMEIEVPDNWEHALSYNLPLDELIEVMNHALQNGYTVCWDGDVSEQGFSFKNGVAINPAIDKNIDNYKGSDRAHFEKLDSEERLEEAYKFQHPCPEIKVTPEIRQVGFETFVTTDDHLMHVTGIEADQNGTYYYRTKNSWGTDRNAFDGYINMSESFVRSKTIYIMMHKDAIPTALRKKLGL